MAVAFGQTSAKSPAPSQPGQPAIERRLVISGQGYFPVAMRLQDERIAVVFRGGAGHLGIKGRLDIVFSSDEGASWTKPQIVVDTPDDDRNPAFGQTHEGTLVVGFWRTATYDDAGRYDFKSSRPTSTWVTRSRDGGRVWSPPVAIDVSDIAWGSPYGRILALADGSLLMAIYGGGVGAGPRPSNTRQHSYVYRSLNDGATWHRLTEIGAGQDQFSETSLVQMPSGELLAAMRSRGGETWLARSSDNGHTWGKAAPLLPKSVHPVDMVLGPDTRLVLVAGDRRGPLGVQAVVANALQELDWKRATTLVNDAVSADCGYPSSVVLRDGRVLTVYYATGVKEHPEWGMHCGAIVWRPDLLAPDQLRQPE